MLNEMRCLNNDHQMGNTITALNKLQWQLWDNVYSGVPVKGYLFHICKAIFSHVQGEKLDAQYMDNKVGYD